MRKKRKAPRIVLPPRPFLAGTFDFPFSRGVRGAAITLAVMATVVGFLARESASLVASGDGKLSFLGGIFVVLTVMGSAVFLAFGGACAVAIVGDTANGCDRIARWPGAVFLDWIGESLLVVCGFAAAAAAGVGVGWLLRETGRPNDGVAALSAFLLFPVVLLSMFDNETMVEPLSSRVFRTFWVCPDAWGAFYACAALVVGGAATILALALPGGATWGLLLSGATVAFAWLVTFRLLGRLALACAVRSAPPPEADDDDAPEPEAPVLEDPMARQRDE